MMITQAEKVEAGQRAGDAVVEARRLALKAANITIGRLAKEFSIIAFSDIKTYVNITPAGTIEAVPLNEISPKRASRAIRKLKERKKIYTDENDAVIEDVQTEYELYDKMDALKYLTKLGGWEPSEKHEISGTITHELADRIREARERSGKE